MWFRIDVQTYKNTNILFGKLPSYYNSSNVFYLSSNNLGIAKVIVAKFYVVTIGTPEDVFSVL